MNPSNIKAKMPQFWKILTVIIVFITIMILIILISLNISASINVKNLRTTSIFLSEIILLSPIPTSPALYLRSLGDKAYIVGTQIESIYVSGSFTLVELFNELQDI